MMKLDFAEVFNQACDAMFVTDANGSMVYANPALEQLCGYPREVLLGQNPRILKSGKHGEDFYRRMWETILAGNVWRSRIFNKGKDGSVHEVDETVTGLRSGDGQIQHFLAVLRAPDTNTGDLERLVTAQKMEAVGELAAGIAHEINTPTQYIGDNLQFLKESFEKLTPLLRKYRDLVSLVPADGAADSAITEIETLVKSVDVDFLTEEVPAALNESLEGNRKVAAIVRAVREFVHPDSEDMVPVDINHAIENAIAIARNEWKYVAEVKTDFDAALPQVRSIPGALNQVVLNLLVNAAQAIADASDKGHQDKGTITVSTRTIGTDVVISVADTGPGIPAAIRSRIFEPFFTTKRPGKGTGQGLAIAHALVCERLGGSLSFETEENKGTAFSVRIPLVATNAD